MWHIVLIGYLFVAIMYSAAQPSIVRTLIYLVFWAVLPTVFTVFVVTTRRRNRLMKQQEQAESEQQRAQRQKDSGTKP
jgi:putative membrane protein